MSHRLPAGPRRQQCHHGMEPCKRHQEGTFVMRDSLPGDTLLHWKGKGNPMPSNVYFEELTTAVLMDADEVKGFLQRQSPQECQELVEGMHERIVETFTQLLEVELEQVGKLHEWQERVEKIKRAAQEAAAETT